MSIEVIRDETEWTRLTGQDLVDDPYLDWNYLEIWAREEAAEAVRFCFEQGVTRVIYPLLRVDLSPLPEGAGFVDLRTAYDFGGPRMIGDESPQVWADFRREWKALCVESNVVTEFARLHPFAAHSNPVGADKHADNILVDLRLGLDEVRQLQHKNHRWAVRRAARHGLTFSLETAPAEESIAAWIRLYGETMSRVGAPSFYGFSNELFTSLLAIPGISLATVQRSGEIVAQAIVLQSGVDLFYYLSASSPAGREYKASNFLLDEVIRHGCEKGCRYFHLGGGNESLRHFKSQVGTGSVPYYVRREVHDERTYSQLTANVESMDSVFPAYLQSLRKRLRSHL